MGSSVVVIEPVEDIAPPVAQVLAEPVAAGAGALVAPVVERGLGDVEPAGDLVDRDHVGGVAEVDHPLGKL